MEVLRKLKIAQQEWVLQGNQTLIQITLLQPLAIEVNYAKDKA